MKHCFRFPFLLCAVGLFASVISCGGPKPGQVTTVNGVEMVYIPGGTFMMGDSTTGRFQVTLRPFLIDKHEVTNGQYRAFARTFGISFPVPPSYDDLPVVNVAWEAADAFAAWRGCRLPTEAEWEFAARGTDGRHFPWGDEFDLKNANGDDGVESLSRPDGSQDGFAGLAPVGMFPQGASPFGVEDMAGNVWEWVHDWFGPYPATLMVEYRGPDTGERKVLRGGSYRTSSANLRTFHRAYRPPPSFDDDIGFRCACDYPVPERGALPPNAQPADTAK